MDRSSSPKTDQFDRFQSNGEKAMAAHGALGNAVHINRQDWWTSSASSHHRQYSFLPASPLSLFTFMTKSRLVLQCRKSKRPFISKVGVVFKLRARHV